MKFKDTLKMMPRIKLLVCATLLFAGSLFWFCALHENWNVSLTQGSVLFFLLGWSWTEVVCFGWRRDRPMEDKPVGGYSDNI